MEFNQSKNKDLEKIPKPVHLWQVDGFVRLSDRARIKFEELIKQEGIRKLAKSLKFDKETVYSIYKGGKFIHSVPHLIKIAKALEYDLKELEREVTSYGRKQTNIYNLNFPFILSPLHLRAVTIHGDGCFNRITNQCSWYQLHERISYMENLLRTLLKNQSISALKKDDKISYITIPSVLVYLVCKSLDLKLNELDSIKFFEKVCQLSKDFQFQVFSQFIIDEGNFKSTTLTVSQWNQTNRMGFLMLLDSLGFKHSSPENNKNDITIYGFNFAEILTHINKVTNKYGYIAGFWFKENQFRDICKKAKPYNSFKLVKNRLK